MKKRFFFALLFFLAALFINVPQKEAQAYPGYGKIMVFGCYYNGQLIGFYEACWYGEGTCTPTQCA